MKIIQKNKVVRRTPIFLVGVFLMIIIRSTAIYSLNNEELFFQIPDFLTYVEEIYDKLIKREQQAKIRQEKAKRQEEIYINSTPENMIINISKQYGVNPRLVIAISKLETGHWKSYGYQYLNNWGGLTNGNGKLIAYSSKEQGLVAYIKLLKNEYINKGLDTPEKMCYKYCPPNAIDWARKVRSMMR